MRKPITIDSSFNERIPPELGTISDEMLQSFLDCVYPDLVDLGDKQDCSRYIIYSIEKGELISYVYFKVWEESVEIIGFCTALEHQKEGLLMSNLQHLFHSPLTQHAPKFIAYFSYERPDRTAAHNAMGLWFENHGPSGKTLRTYYVSGKKTYIAK